MELDNVVLRHLLATLAYRATRALEGVPEEFAGFGGGGREPVRILAHMGDLMEWAYSMASGSPRWQNSQPLEWGEETQRFYRSLKQFDAFLESGKTTKAPAERLIQGPVADALTHVGQLAMLRRMAGCPTRGENFYVADVAVGRTGPDQSAPVKTF